MHTHTHTHTHTLMYIYIYIDGRGFITQKKDGVAGLTEVERGFFSGEREISPSQFATVRIIIIDIWIPYRT